VTLQSGAIRDLHFSRPREDEWVKVRLLLGGFIGVAAPASQWLPEGTECSDALQSEFVVVFNVHKTMLRSFVHSFV
jgi:hypothetical protein